MMWNLFSCTACKGLSLPEKDLEKTSLTFHHFHRIKMLNVLDERNVNNEHLLGQMGRSEQLYCSTHYKQFMPVLTDRIKYLIAMLGTAIWIC